MAEPIDPEERSGVLEPANLARFAATWHAPHPGLANVVETYWHVAWSLGDEVVEQRIIEAPAVTVSVEHGDVPWPLVRTTPGPRAWTRTIRGAGEVLGIRLRPAGLAVVSDVPIGAPGTTAVDAEADARLHAILATVAAADSLDGRLRAADAALLAATADRVPTREGLTANAAVAAMSHAVRARSSGVLAGSSDRAVQRALASTVGMGPKAVARRIRLQEAARLLALPDATPADVASALGYADQAHLTNDLRTVAGVTPAAYVRSLRALAG
ncbi:helix-turn-helix transcriptional regulator [Agrococcus jejuensis]|uniref:Helix-turn-helix domain-containing protein n=1 Tax=Agrococcus jejuensis TaxID=399736 RepID=A0A1G8GTH5_9MICO|nr:helix-turn-helix transcriptional regulator [Agrococcus jejuensis]SDH97669.1 Helix-turn-helix domain-containing protein [Agrococcus jejuensis]